MQADGISIVIAIKFVSQLAKPFEEWKAYQLGLIDADGNKIRDPQTAEEKRQFTAWLNLIRNLKRMLVKLPGGRSQIASLAVAFMMLKDSIERKAGEKITVEALKNVLETYAPQMKLAEASVRYRPVRFSESYYLTDDLALDYDSHGCMDCRIIGESLIDQELVLVKTKTGSEIMTCRKSLLPKAS
jgi:hypothetical protein